MGCLVLFVGRGFNLIDCMLVDFRPLVVYGVCFFFFFFFFVLGLWWVVEEVVKVSVFCDGIFVFVGGVLLCVVWFCVYFGGELCMERGLNLSSGCVLFCVVNCGSCV